MDFGKGIDYDPMACHIPEGIIHVPDWDKGCIQVARKYDGLIRDVASAIYKSLAKTPFSENNGYQYELEDLLHIEIIDEQKMKALMSQVKNCTIDQDRLCKLISHKESLYLLNTETVQDILPRIFMGIGMAMLPRIVTPNVQEEGDRTYHVQDFVNPYFVNLMLYAFNIATISKLNIEIGHNDWVPSRGSCKLNNGPYLEAIGLFHQMRTPMDVYPKEYTKPKAAPQP